MEIEKNRPAGGEPDGPDGEIIALIDGGDSDVIPASAKQVSMLEAALSWAAQGFPVFPCKWNGEKGTIKRPLTEHGFKDASTDPALIRAWWFKWPEAFIGMPTGATTGIAVLDLDTHDPARNGMEAVPDWADLSDTIVTTMSGGRHIWCCYEPGLGTSSKALGLPPGCDVRGEGGFVIVPPSAGYAWLKKGDLKNSPPWPDRFPPQVPKAESKQVDQSPVDLAEVAKAMAFITNKDLGWDDWTHIGMALWSATNGSERGFTLFDAWSQQSRKYDPDATRDRWDGITASPPSDIGAGKLFAEAHKTDPNWRRDRAAPVSTEALPTTKHGDPVPPMSWLIRNRLPETGAGLLIGQWGTYKTFMWIDIAASIMTGWHWTDEPVYRRGGVLVFAAEGSGGLGLRIAAMAEHGIAKTGADVPVDLAKLPIEWASSCPTLVSTGSNDPFPIMVATAAAAEKRFQAEFKLPLVMIVIDTLSVCAGWRDENDNADAARVMAVLRRLSYQTGAVVVGIDHAGKNPELGTRGASAKEANSDFVLAIVADRKQTGEVENPRMAFRKLRDGPQGGEKPFAAKLVDMGVDEHKMPVTSRIIDWKVVRKPRTKDLSDSALAFEEALGKSLKGFGILVKFDGSEHHAVDKEKVRTAFHQIWGMDRALKATALDQRFRQALKEAMDTYRVGVGENEHGEWIWREAAF